MANAYVDELLRLTKVLAVTEASQRRMFFETQLERSKKDLANAEVALKKAIDTSGVISVDADSRALMETVGRLRAQISAKEIQLRAMQAYLTTENPEYKRTEEELSSLRVQLEKLENGSTKGVLNNQSSDNKAGLENIKILRDVKYHQMLFELLAKQYEMARLDEAKDPSIIQVLDNAVVPEKKAKPKRLIITLLASVIGLLAAVSIAFLTETKERALSERRTAERWNTFKQYLKFR
jgi:uncharacterized protein involved in exopolysaccharide biosynthesis